MGEKTPHSVGFIDEETDHDKLYEVILNTVQDRYFFISSRLLNLMIAGVLAYAQRRTGLRLCYVAHLRLFVDRHSFSLTSLSRLVLEVLEMLNGSAESDQKRQPAKCKDPDPVLLNKSLLGYLPIRSTPLSPPSRAARRGPRPRPTNSAYRAAFSRLGDGPSIVREINPDRTVASEKKDGITIDLAYDADRRRPTPTDADRRPPAPLLPRQRPARRGNGCTRRPAGRSRVTQTIGGRTLSVKTSDSWGRPFAETAFHDAATSGTKTTVCSPIGLIEREETRDPWRRLPALHL